MYSRLPLQRLGALGLIACDQVLGGGYFVSAVEMATLGLQVATLVVSQELSVQEVATATEYELFMAAA
jgi:hypothetical protein